MYISPIDYGYSSINNNIQAKNLKAANNTNTIAFNGNEPQKETLWEILQSEVHTDYNPDKIKQWADKYGYTTEEKNSKLCVFDKNKNLVRRVSENYTNPGKIYDDTIQIFDKQGKIECKYTRYPNGAAELAFGGYDDGSWRIYALKDKEGNWKLYLPKIATPVPVKPDIDLAKLMEITI